MVLDVKLRILPLNLKWIFENSISIRVKRLFLLVHPLDYFKVTFVDDVYSCCQLVLMEQVGASSFCNCCELRDH